MSIKTFTTKEGWKKYKLGDFVDLVTKGTTPSTIKRGYKKVGINFIKSECITKDGFIDLSHAAFIDLETNSKLSRSIIKENDILFSIAGMYLAKTAIVKKEHLPANTNQAVAIIRVKHDIIDYRFLNYLFKDTSFIEMVYKFKAQSAQPNISLGDIKSFEILIPLLFEQKKIAEILGAYDDLIEVNQKKIKILEDMAQTIYKEWFVKPVKNGLPKGWEIMKVTDLVSFERGIEPGSINYSEVFGENKVKFIRVSDLNKENNNFVDIDLCKNKFCNPNDILVSFDGSIGIVRYGLSGAYSTGIRKLKSDSFSNGFLYFYMKSEYVQNTIKEYAKGTTILHAGDAIKYMEVLLPDKEFLLKTNKFFEEILNTLINLNLQDRKLQKTRDLLIPQLVGGNILIK